MISDSKNQAYEVKSIIKTTFNRCIPRCKSQTKTDLDPKPVIKVPRVDRYSPTERPEIQG